MRHFFITICCLFIAVTGVNAQDQVEMSVIMSCQPAEISQNTLSVLRNKLAAAITRNGISSVDYCGVVLRPDIIFTNKQITEGGMRNVVVADMQLNLTVEHVITGTVFNSMTIDIRGGGNTIDQAVAMGITQLGQDDNRRIILFIEQSKEKIINYYKTNIDALIQKANTLASMNKYDEAIALLYDYPSFIDGYKAASSSLVAIFKKYQSAVCGQILQRARAAYSQGNYSEAAALLQNVDMQSSCASEAKSLCRQIKNSRDKEAAQQMAAYERLYQSQVSLEKHRVDAIRDVAKSYFKSLPNYYFILW